MSVKPSNFPTSVKGKIMTRLIINKVDNNKYLPGLLFNIDFLILKISTMVHAEIIDSINHVVPN